LVATVLGFTLGPPVWTIAFVKPILFPPLINPKLGACGTMAFTSRAVALVIWNAGSRTVDVQKKEKDIPDDAPRPLAVTLKGPLSRKAGLRALLATGVKMIELAETPLKLSSLLGENAKLTSPIEQLVPKRLLSAPVAQVFAKAMLGIRHRQQRASILETLNLRSIHPS
jgi:hypothetical protein